MRHSRNSTRGRAVVLVLALFASSALLELSNGAAGPMVALVEARSLLDIIPGTELMRDLASNMANRLGRALDNQIINPISNNLGGCFKRGADGACPPRDPDASRTVAEIIKSRGFEVEEHDVTTRDGYILTVQRIINPLIEEGQRAKLKPVILQHGLMSSSVDWVINSVHVKPQKYPRDSSAPSTTNPTTTTASGASASGDILDDDDNEKNTIEFHRRSAAMARGDGEEDGSNEEQRIDATTPSAQMPTGDSQEHPNALGFYLANEGYDVFLANSRGNIYGQRHVEMSSWNPRFWAFTFDEQIKYDLPDTASYIKNLTGHSKLGYVGHSQGTAMMFGLLSDQPDYADVFEPVVMLAPVAYVSNSISPVKYFAVYTPIFEHVNMWFGSSNVAVRYLAPLVCKPELIKNEVCANIIFLSTGFDAEEFDMSRASAYLGHMPSGTSVKNIAHYGQEVLSGRFAHFDHGILGNQVQYGQTKAPDYELGNIRSKSLVLFTAENDWLASPKDVAKLKADLRVTPYSVYNITEDMPKWNHIDFVYGIDCGQLVNTRILEAFHHFD
uniref:Gastric triacylglycerol lipase n=1 Tax=Aceria tosichella TaxID=561515 RepID=A0A6G1S6G4_9ACAR